MTRERAIAVLYGLRTYWKNQASHATALDMAIQLMERASDHDFPEERPQCQDPNETVTSTRR